MCKFTFLLGNIKGETAFLWGNKCGFATFLLGNICGVFTFLLGNMVKGETHRRALLFNLNIARRCVVGSSVANCSGAIYRVSRKNRNYYVDAMYRVPTDDDLLR